MKTFYQMSSEEMKAHFEVQNLGLTKQQVSESIEKYGENIPSMTAIGYREITSFLKGEIDLQTAVSIIKKRTHAFVRRQANWFKPSDPNIKWFDSNTYQLETVLSYINSPLGWK